MIYTNIQISPKAGEKIQLRFAIEQDCPSPRIGSHSGSLRWENSERMFSGPFGPAAPLKQAYTCWLLKAGLNSLPEQWDLKSMAGYEGNPGSFKLRGNDIGLLRIEIELSQHTLTYAQRTKVRNFESPTPGEGRYIYECIVPRLVDAIRRNRDALHHSAKQKVINKMRGEIAGARARLVQLEAEIQKATF